MSSRSYLSIGDVLTLLRQEFPDVTISKIRFLESQGLVNPERTPSGYRKFYEHDVERLRWVLRQQREHFLPLKVIKDRLDEDGNGAPSAAAPATSAPVDPTSAPAAAVPPDDATSSGGATTDEASVLVAPGATTVDAGATAVDAGATAVVESASGLPGIESGVRHRAPSRATAGATPSDTPSVTPSATPGAAAAAVTAPVERAHRASLATQPAPSAARTADPSEANGTAAGVTTNGPTGHAEPSSASPSTPPTPKASKGSSRKPATAQAAAETPPVAAPSGDGGGGPAPGVAGVGGAGISGATLSLEDLCAASGLSADDVAELQEYGLLTSTVAAGVQFFDEEALSVASLAAKFAAFGIEARHLRLYKNAAEREAGFIEQIVIPMVRQRNPEARARATQTAEELTVLGQQMKASLLRTALRDIL